MAAVGVLAVLATVIVTVETRSADGGFWLRMLFVAFWLASALLVAERGDRGAATVVTVVFLISFPIAFSGASAGLRSSIRSGGPSALSRSSPFCTSFPAASSNPAGRR